jgi:hypothetical protein
MNPVMANLMLDLHVANHDRDEPNIRQHELLETKLLPGERAHLKRAVDFFSGASLRSEVDALGVTPMALARR